MNRMHTMSIGRPELLSRVAWWAFAVLLLTTVHHVYGAYAFDTPWRLHAVLVSVPAGVAIATSRFLLGRHPNDALGAIAFWMFVLVTLLIPVVGFGLFEGAYNHVLKNALYFGGASPGLMNDLFPPPAYELPSDAFFEISGVMQAVPGGVTGWLLYRVFRPRSTTSMTTVSGDALEV